MRYSVLLVVVVLVFGALMGFGGYRWRTRQSRNRMDRHASDAESGS